MSVFSTLRMGVRILALHLSRLRYQYLLSALVAVLLATCAAGALLLPTSRFPAGQVLTIDPGTSVGQAASELRQAQAINSRLLFKAIYRFIPGVHGVQSGKYVFARPVGILTVAWNVTHGISGIPRIKVTFPEGTTVRQMGSMLASAIPGFDEQKFDSLALGKATTDEGYLFPDTYYFLPNTSEADAIAILQANYAARTASLKPAEEQFGKSEHDIITMASLLEGEGKTLEDKRMISGILWHRIALGMPLQVDAAFGYIYGRTGYVPTVADLKGNSAYNTYRYKGLPPTPINNPGLISIQAAISPIHSDYLYYLTGSDGQMRYAKTFAEHIANEKKYLK